MKMKRLTIINILITVLVFIGNYFYQSLGFNYTLKIICSSGFAFLGDVAINPNFILGVIFFAMGHVFFVTSYLAHRKLEKLDVVLSVALGTFAVGSILFFISDMRLLLAWFSTIEGRWTSNVCMAAYYPALCLLAGSMVVYLNNDRERTACTFKRDR